MEVNKNSVLGLFSGIGGFELGLSLAGFEPYALCEIEPGAQAVLEARFPLVDVIKDVKDIEKLSPKIKIITAGFPCQDLSSSGQKVGINGERSFLVDEVFRLLETSSEVDWVILENVKFMLHLNKGSAMSYITSALENLGYNWAYRVINTESFGLPQRRHRVYFVASKKYDPRGIILVDDAVENPNKHSIDENIPRGFYWTEGRYSTGMSHNGIPPLKAGSTIGIPSPPAILLPDGFVGTPDIKDSERLQGFSEDWTKPAELVCKASHRWKLIGNSVSVPVVEWIGRRLNSPMIYDDKNDTVFHKDDKWPSSAWYFKKERKKSNVTEWPVNNIFIGLDTFLKYPLKPLSARAVNGYISRAKKGNLKHPDGFLEKLDDYLLGIS